MVVFINVCVCFKMTGRKGRVVSTEDGQVQYESRSEIDAPLEVMNLTEKQRFMDGEKVSSHLKFDLNNGDNSICSFKFDCN